MPNASLSIGEGGKVQVRGQDGDLRFSGDQATIQFARSVEENAPMMEMFPSGTNNSTRMVIAHSPGFRTWGLQYNDTLDAFTWLGNAKPAMHLNLASGQEVGLGTTDPKSKLHIDFRDLSGDGHLRLTETGTNRFSRIFFDNNAFDGHWEIRGRVNSTLAASSMNIAHSEAGNIFTMSAEGYVGINDGIPSYPLDVDGMGRVRSINVASTMPATSSSTSGYGVYVRMQQQASSGTPRLYNLYGTSNDADAYLAYGVYGAASDAGESSYGVYGTTPTNDGYAGFFSGYVFTNAAYLPSDAKLKADVRPLQNALETIMALTPKTYAYATQRFDFMNLPEGEQYGFLAHELESVLPSLTKDSFHPYEEPLDDSEAGQGLRFKALNYQGIVPILVAAMQEQQKQFEEQAAKLSRLEARLNQLEANTQANTNE